MPRGAVPPAQGIKPVLLPTGSRARLRPVGDVATAFPNTLTSKAYASARLVSIVSSAEVVVLFQPSYTLNRLSSPASIYHFDPSTRND